MSDKRSIIAEFSIVPIGTSSTSVSRQVAEAIKAASQVEGLKTDTNAMGTVLEAPNIDIIFDAIKRADEALFNLGEKRVQIILKIDDRRDKLGSIKSKVEAVKKYNG